MQRELKGEILLCEDSKMIRDVVTGHLMSAGFKTTVAENGRAAVEMVQSRAANGLKPFDLIFMDVNMPVMNGLEATVRICKLNTGTPVIAITASHAPSDREQYKACGMSDCVSKPFTPQELSDCLEKHIPSAAQ